MSSVRPHNERGAPRLWHKDRQKLRASKKERARRGAELARHCIKPACRRRPSSTFFVINAMQGPQRPRRASAWALDVPAAPEQHNSFEAASGLRTDNTLVVVDS